MLERDRQYVWHPFTQAQTAPDPLLMVRGEGALLYDATGQGFVDLVSSWWVNLHGHAHPEIAQAIAEQAQTLEQVMFAGFTHPPAVQLAEALVAAAPAGLQRVFYSDNGSTAVEVALKIALQRHGNLGESQRTRFLAFEGGYHGDTVGAMSVGVSSSYFSAWHAMLFPVDVLPLPVTWDGDARVEEKEAAALLQLDGYLQRNADSLAAMVIEPLVQGASGMRMHRPQFLQKVVQKVRAAGALVIFDEVMTGFGRTETLFASEQVGEAPDMLCLSKGLTGGFLPMGATLTTEALYQAFLGESVGMAFLHGHSYTANPLGCAAALASLRLTLADDCRARRAAMEVVNREAVQALAAELPAVTEPRVCGTIAAVTLRDPARGEGYASAYGPELIRLCRQRGLLVRPMGNVLYVLPPYCLGADGLRAAWQQLTEVVSQLAPTAGSGEMIP